MDIGKLGVKGRVYEVAHPKTGDAIGIRVMLLSLEDDKVKRLRRQIMDRASKLQLKGKFITAVEQEANHIDLLFAAVEGWDWYGDVDFNGAKPAFNRGTFGQICEALPWFKEQLDEQISETANFISA